MRLSSTTLSFSIFDSAIWSISASRLAVISEVTGKPAAPTPAPTVAKTFPVSSVKRSASLWRNLPEPVRADRPLTFEFTPPGASRSYLAVAHPLRLEGRGPPFGLLVVSKPRAELSDRLNTLLERLALAFLGGVLVAGRFQKVVTSATDRLRPGAV